MKNLSATLLALTVLPGAQAQLPEERPNLLSEFQNLIDSADQDGDGAITREEYEQARLQSFTRLDRDGDGSLSPNEYERAPTGERLAQIQDPRAQAARLAVEQARAANPNNPDTNGDGMISQDEFMAMPNPGFERVDQNADGVLSAEEVETLQERPARRLRRNP